MVYDVFRMRRGSRDLCMRSKMIDVGSKVGMRFISSNLLLLTDGIGMAYTRYSIYAVVRKNL